MIEHDPQDRCPRCKRGVLILDFMDEEGEPDPQLVLHCEECHFFEKEKIELDL